MSKLAFTKMHGLGNDFIVLDARDREIDLGGAAARALSDRRHGIGCDQILIMETAANDQADIFMRILNADGTEAEACGNGTRCVAKLVMAETGRDAATIETRAGVLKANAAAGGLVSVDMGPANLDWQVIPLAREMDTLNLEISAGPLSVPVGVNMGNPHAVFFVDDVELIPLEDIGPKIETDPLFPEKTNVEAAQVLDDGSIRLRVWERGVGITQACGSGACATLVAASRRGLVGRSATIHLDGGDLDITWADDNHVIMTGPVATSFTGVVDLVELAG
ncbi:MAG: diaminopimelate epimerase [Proteobacteria bacterium]|nr:diaminopimelate epimerase [Pseudomonadota bacterium]MDA1022283.1 diaminopimelate epimerase [Pseudomonadota bacterium]